MAEALGRRVQAGASQAEGLRQPRDGQRDRVRARDRRDLAGDGDRVRVLGTRPARERRGDGPRKDEPYAKYDEVEFDVPVGRNGDSYDRLWVLVQRMHESCAIIEQCMEKLPAGDYIAGKLPKKLARGRDLRAHREPARDDGLLRRQEREEEPYRLKMRTPSFSNVSVLPAMLPGSLVPDLIALLGSIFFVVGDIDR